MAILLLLNSHTLGWTPQVVGWYVGTNVTEYPLSEINWQVYTHIRSGEPHVSPAGVATCVPSAFSIELRSAAEAHGRAVTWGPGIDAWKAISNASAVEVAYRARYVATIGAASLECGIAGIEFDYECPPTPAGRAGVVTREEATAFTQLMVDIRAAGDAAISGFQVSADVGVWGLDGAWHKGSSYPLMVTPWIDAALLAATPNVFVNTMSYHTPTDCGIELWKVDAFFAHTLWRIPKNRINLGIGYYTFNASSEPTWRTLSARCKEIPPSQCVCDGVSFASKEMNEEIGALIKSEGYRGAFPWAANYDAFGTSNDSLARWLGKGLGVVEVGAEEQKQREVASIDPQSASVVPAAAAAAAAAAQLISSPPREGTCYVDPSVCPGQVPGRIGPHTGCQLSYCACEPCPALTPRRCGGMCAGLNFTFFGLEAGHRCWCGDAVANVSLAVSAKQCNTPCSGNASMQCGAPYRIVCRVRLCDTSTSPSAVSSPITHTRTLLTSLLPPSRSLSLSHIHTVGRASRQHSAVAAALAAALTAAATAVAQPSHPHTAPDLPRPCR